MLRQPRGEAAKLKYLISTFELLQSKECTIELRMCIAVFDLPLLRIELQLICFSVDIAPQKLQKDALKGRFPL